jgi:hypothetical protein
MVNEIYGAKLYCNQLINVNKKIDQLPQLYACTRGKLKMYYCEFYVTRAVCILTFTVSTNKCGASCSVVAKALRYKPTGRGFDTFRPQAPSE